MLDASAFLRATQGNREAIDTLRAHRYGKIRLHVPETFYFEVANALRTSVSHAKIVGNDAHSALASALDLDVKVESASALASEALDFALERGFTVYDAGYAVLALRRQATLVTADLGLAQAARSAGVAVTLIEEGIDHDP